MIPKAWATNTTATPCIIAVPSMLIVAPSGTVKDDMFSETPNFSSNVSMDKGIEALDDAVENAKLITGANLLKNFIGLSFVKPLSISIYVTKQWIANAKNTANIYFKSGAKAFHPIVEKVVAIRQNTPIGAAFITIVVIFIIISLNCVKNLPTVSALSFNCAKIRPIKRANTIIWSIFPCANEFIDTLLNGYDTYIEQGGTNVSGGQKQRLCIARALLKKPKILILDDSTSAVDTATDAKIRTAFSKEIPNTTKIIIAQRISSVQDADKIIVLDDGKISGIGTHEELLENNEIYADVYNSQVKGDDDEYEVAK